MEYDQLLVKPWSQLGHAECAQALKNAYLAGLELASQQARAPRFSTTVTFEEYDKYILAEDLPGEDDNYNGYDQHRENQFDLKDWKEEYWSHSPFKDLRVMAFIHAWKAKGEECRARHA